MLFTALSSALFRLGHRPLPLLLLIGALLCCCRCEDPPPIDDWKQELPANSLEELTRKWRCVENNEAGKVFPPLDKKLRNYKLKVENGKVMFEIPETRFESKRRDAQARFRALSNSDIVTFRIIVNKNKTDCTKNTDERVRYGVEGQGTCTKERQKNGKHWVCPSNEDCHMDLTCRKLPKLKPMGDSGFYTSKGNIWAINEYINVMRGCDLRVEAQGDYHLLVRKAGLKEEDLLHRTKAIGDCTGKGKLSSERCHATSACASGGSTLLTVLFIMPSILLLLLLALLSGMTIWQRSQLKWIHNTFADELLGAAGGRTGMTGITKLGGAKSKLTTKAGGKTGMKTGLATTKGGKSALTNKTAATKKQPPSSLITHKSKLMNKTSTKAAAPAPASTSKVSGRGSRPISVPNTSEDTKSRGPSKTR